MGDDPLTRSDSHPAATWTPAEAARVMAQSQRGLPQRQAASRANAALAGRPPREPYHTRLHDASCEGDGDAGDSVRTIKAAQQYAERVLRVSGHRLDVLAADGRLVARYACDGRHVWRERL